MKFFDFSTLFTESDAQRFWSKVDRRGPGECWDWTKGCLESGYGEFRVRGKTLRTNRVAFFLVHGRLPDDLACHTCDNRKCCNAYDHIYDGTYKKNAADMFERGRAHGIERRLGRAVVTENQVREIRSLFDRGLASQTELARSFGVNFLVVFNIVHRKYWTHIV